MKPDIWDRLIDGFFGYFFIPLLYVALGIIVITLFILLFWGFVWVGHFAAHVLPWPAWML